MALPRLFSSFQSVHGQHSHDLVNQWYKTSLGCKVFEEEKTVLDQVLPELFGYHLMQLGGSRLPQLSASSPIKHRIFVEEHLAEELAGNAEDQQHSLVLSRVTELAVATDSIDVAVLHHSLDFHNDPQGILREVARTVMPGGEIVIVGFNPWSWWGGIRLFLKKSSRCPWNGNFLSPYRVSDWLNLLDFQIEGCECVCYGLPTENPKVTKAFSWVAGLAKRWLSQTGAIYIVVATKRVATFTPIKPKRFRSPSLVSFPLKGLAGSTSRNSLNRTDRH